MENCYLCKRVAGEFYCNCDQSLSICRQCCREHNNIPGNHFIIDRKDLDVNRKFIEASQAAKSLEQVKMGLIEEGREISHKVFSAIDMCLVDIDKRIKMIADLIKNNIPFEEFEDKVQEFLMENNILAFKNTLKESLLNHFNQDNIKEKILVYDELKLIREEIIKGNLILEKLIKFDKKPELDEKMQKLEENIEYFNKELIKIKQFTQENIEKRLKDEITSLKGELSELEKLGTSEINELKEEFSKFVEKTEKKYNSVLKT